MSSPICGADTRSNCIDDEKQFHTGLTPPIKKSIRHAYKCSSCLGDQSNSIGRYIGNGSNIADQQIETIEKTTGYNPLTLDLETNRYLDCPWNSLVNPLWREVKYFLNLKEIPGTTNINDSTDNIVFEAVLFYENCYRSVDNYVVGKQIEKREQERKETKAKQAMRK